MVRALLAQSALPPAVNDARCDDCSLHDICQPEAVAAKGAVAHAIRNLYHEENDGA
jgi:CRISPR-associated exonuclease Cas4